MARPTTLGIGDGGRRAFTLMEVLVVIALLGLVTAVVVADFGAPGSAGKESAYEVVSRALDSGRGLATDAGGPVTLTYDAESRRLRLLSGAGLTDYVLPAGSSVRFTLPAAYGEGRDRPLAGVVFHPSGCATPARITLTVAGAETHYRLEAFSVALMPEAMP